MSVLNWGPAGDGQAAAVEQARVQELAHDLRFYDMILYYIILYDII